MGLSNACSGQRRALAVQPKRRARLAYSVQDGDVGDDEQTHNGQVVDRVALAIFLPVDAASMSTLSARLCPSTWRSTVVLMRQGGSEADQPDLVALARCEAQVATSRSRGTRISCVTKFVYIGSVKNLTITVEESVLEWARIEAAKRGSSVSRMVGELLAEKMRLEDAYQRAYRQWEAEVGKGGLSSGGVPYLSRDEIYAERTDRLR